MSYPASQRRSLLQEARCQTCSLSSLCLPLALELEDMSQFDAIIRRRSPLKKGELQSKKRSGTAFQNTLLRHVHVTLGLRHPWLRTVLESRP